MSSNNKRSLIIKISITKGIDNERVLITKSPIMKAAIAKQLIMKVAIININNKNINTFNN